MNQNGACRREAGGPVNFSSSNVLWPGGPRLGWAYPVPETLRAQAFLYSVVCLYSLLHVVFSPVARKREVSLTATAIHACGCLAYLVMGNAWMPFLYTQDARPVLVVRSLEWAISVPLFLRMLAQLIEPGHKQLRKYQATQSLAILLGCLLGPFFVASPVHRINTYVAWGCFGVACALQVAVLQRYHYFFLKMRRSIGAWGRDRTLLGVAHVSIFALFALYPAVWYAGVLAQMISPETETLAFAWMDLVSKFIFSTALCNMTSRSYDLNLADSAAQFWKFVRVIGLPLFALSKDGRVVFWNRPMSLLTQTNSSDVLYRHIKELDAVFPLETQSSLLHMLAGKEVEPLPGTGKDTRYQVPLLRSGGPVSILPTFSLLTNYLDEVAIPRMVFVGTQSGNTRPLMAQSHQAGVGGGGGGGGGGVAAPPPVYNMGGAERGGGGRVSGSSSPPVSSQDFLLAPGGKGSAEGGAPDSSSQAFVQLAYALHNSTGRKKMD